MNKGKSHSATDEALGKTPTETEAEIEAETKEQIKPEIKKAQSKSKPKTSQKDKDKKIAAGDRMSNGADLPSSQTSTQQAELDQLKSELAQIKDTNLRLQAEIQNIQRRSVQEIHKSQINAMLTMAPLLLETIDNLEKALQFGLNIETSQNTSNLKKENKSDVKKHNQSEAKSNNNSKQKSAGHDASYDDTKNLSDASDQDPDIDNSSSDINSVIEGVALTYKSFVAGLQKIGVEEINPIDQQFDPEYHEAFARIKIAGKKSGAVVAVMQKGYKMGDRLLRAAKVQVAE